ncbi:MAG: hydroxymethylglutaryl-CoA reductase, degradative [Candidatus Brocadiae bacterium]|nr:hydroxymethylglutaryl-CoA reductase, degradative [Candidatus Brocadiia bacterium]
MTRHFCATHFYKLSPEERLERIANYANLNEEEIQSLKSSGGLSLDQADRMIENVIGTLEIPIGLGVHFLINDREYNVPMAIEEPSVVAAASKMAKIARKKGGFIACTTEPIMIGQIQIASCQDPYGAKMRILSQKDRILQMANEEDPILVKFGGGAVDLEVKVLDTASGPMVVCHLLVNCKDAMGANAVNTMAESLKGELEKISQGKVCLRIISNLAIHRMARAYAVFDKEELGGAEIVDRIVAAYHFADADPFRGTTHNKGIMNGISAVALACGQDTRAIEAGAHSYAAIKGSYRSLTTWEKNSDGDLVGTLELPMAVGIVGGATKTHPVVKANLQILGIQSANELGEVMVCVGLAQNLGALRALADEGIQKGHMSLHARNLAIMAGCPSNLVDIVVERLKKVGSIRLDKAQAIVKELLSAENALEDKVIF